MTIQHPQDTWIRRTASKKATRQIERLVDELGALYGKKLRPAIYHHHLGITLIDHAVQSRNGPSAGLAVNRGGYHEILYCPKKKTAGINRVALAHEIAHWLHYMLPKRYPRYLRRLIARARRLCSSTASFGEFFELKGEQAESLLRYMHSRSEMTANLFGQIYALHYYPEDLWAEVPGLWPRKALKRLDRQACRVFRKMVRQAYRCKTPTC